IGISPIGDRYILCKIAGLYQLKDGIVDTIPGLDPLIHYNFRSIASISENELIAGSEKQLYRITLANNDFKIQTYDLARFAPIRHLRAVKVNGNDLWLAGR